MRRAWPLITLLLLLLGYMGYYLCRANFAVVTPLLLKEYDLLGLEKTHIAYIAAFGTLMYTVGKVVNGVIGDFVGGKVLFVLGMAISVLATLYSSVALGMTTLLVGWGANRLAQSAGWGAVAKTTALWFSYPQYGRIMGLLSLSFLFGDSLARLFLGYLVNQGYGWRGIYLVSAAGLGGVALLTWWCLPRSPERKRLAPAEPNPRNLYGEQGNREHPRGLRMLLTPYLARPAFWVVAFMSMGLTAMRETINQWSNTYLTEAAGLSPGLAAQYSALFPFVGGVSALLAGYITDRYTRGRRGLYILLCMLSLALVYGCLYFTGGVKVGLFPALTALALMGLLMIGPYTFLAGAMALDLGAKPGSATAVGLIDGAGYLGSLLVGIAIGYLVQDASWSGSFLLMALLSLLTAAAAWVYWRRHEVRMPR
ncbi:MAG: MFS transporter [Bacteroidetes bacterium]|nr:MFS transporter [Bacteroidota bacterium]